MHRTLAAVLAIALAGCAPKRCATAVPQKVPTSREQSGQFVQRWNEYAKALEEGYVPLEMWSRVVKAWERMTE
jgi:hypothetical protein